MAFRLSIMASTIWAFVSAAGCTTKVHVCFVLDGSGSMQGEELGVQSFVKSLSSQLSLSPGGSSAGVVQFASSATTLTYPAMTTSYNEVSRAVGLYAASGVTNIGAGLTMGKDNLLAVASDGLPRVIVLLSDGEQSSSFGGTPAAVATAGQIKAKNISIFAIAFGSVSASSLQNIASSPASNFVFRDSSLDLVSAQFRSLFCESTTNTTEEITTTNTSTSSSLADTTTHTSTSTTRTTTNTSMTSLTTNTTTSTTATTTSSTTTNTTTNTTTSTPITYTRLTTTTTTSSTTTHTTTNTTTGPATTTASTTITNTSTTTTSTRNTTSTANPPTATTSTSTSPTTMTTRITATTNTTTALSSTTAQPTTTTSTTTTSSTSTAARLTSSTKTTNATTFSSSTTFKVTTTNSTTTTSAITPTRAIMTTTVWGTTTHTTTPTSLTTTASTDTTISSSMNSTQPSNTSTTEVRKISFTTTPITSTTTTTTNTTTNTATTAAPIATNTASTSVTSMSTITTTTTVTVAATSTATTTAIATTNVTTITTTTTSTAVQSATTTATKTTTRTTITQINTSANSTLTISTSMFAQSTAATTGTTRASGLTSTVNVATATTSSQGVCRTSLLVLPSSASGSNCPVIVYEGQQCAVTCSQNNMSIGFFTCSQTLFVGQSVCIASSQIGNISLVTKIAATLDIVIVLPATVAQVPVLVEDMFKRGIADALGIPISSVAQLRAIEKSYSTRLLQSIRPGKLLGENAPARHLNSMQTRRYEVSYEVVVPSSTDVNTLMQKANRMTMPGRAESQAFQLVLSSKYGVTQFAQVALKIPVRSFPDQVASSARRSSAQSNKREETSTLSKIIIASVAVVSCCFVVLACIVAIRMKRIFKEFYGTPLQFGGAEVISAPASKAIDCDVEAASESKIIRQPSCTLLGPPIIDVLKKESEYEEDEAAFRV